jgi:putative transposase
MKRQQVPPTDDWQQLQLLAKTPEQRTYELIRPVVLFGQPASVRARETGVPQRTLYRQADAFDQQGMASLAPPPKLERHQQLPAPIRQAIIELKREYAALNTHEITTICWARFGHRPSPRTVKRILAEAAPAPPATRRFPPYHAFADPVAARLAIIRLHIEGWNTTRIAGYLAISRDTVYRTLQRWVAEGVAGLDDKSHARKDGPRKVDLRAIATVKELQENPGLDEWRVHAALKCLGIHLSPRTCGPILALNRKLYGLPKPVVSPKAPKPMPFAALRRHQIWSVDLRYLDMHRLGGGNIYVISILDNYSRAILASGLSRTQDLTAYLLVLYAAIRQHGAPEALVSDGGSVFKAKQALRIYEALGIRKEQIDRKQPWQNYIETTFNIMRRMADWDFGRAATWAELLAAHDQWVVNYNYQDHWAHRHRDEAARSPAAVLSWVHGRAFAPEELHRVFYATRFGRKVDRLGYVRFRHWRVYGERGVAGEQAAVWLYGEHLTVEFADEPLAQYRVTYQPDKRHLKTVADPHLFETPHRAPQPPLWQLGDGEWLTVLRLSGYAPRTRREGNGGQQAALFTLEQGN